MSRQLLVTTALVVLFLWSALARAAGVQARFSLEAPSAGPFPSNLFTVPDPQQHTGLRVHMPLPNCAERPSDCTTLAEINTLDGFNVQPRLSIPFSGPIDVASVSSTTVFLVSLGSPLAGGDPGGTVVGINQIVWDPETNTLHAASDALLAQHTPYALIVTQGIRDTTGRPVEASEAFARFRHDLPWGPSKDPALQAYRRALLQGLAAARGAGVHPADIVVASVFTTQSITAVLEQIREQIQTATPAPAEFRLGPDGRRTAFALGQVSDLLFTAHTGTAPTFTPMPLTPSWRCYKRGLEWSGSWRLANTCRRTMKRRPRSSHRLAHGPVCLPSRASRRSISTSSSPPGPRHRRGGPWRFSGRGAGRRNKRACSSLPGSWRRTGSPPSGSMQWGRAMARWGH